MKKISAIVLFFCTNALLVFFEVHKQGQITKSSYEIQNLQAKIASLQKEKRSISFKLHALQEPDELQSFAENTLKMRPIQLKHVKQTSGHNE